MHVPVYRQAFVFLPTPQGANIPVQIVRYPLPGFETVVLWPVGPLVGSLILVIIHEPINSSTPPFQAQTGGMAGQSGAFQSLPDYASC